MKKNKILHVLTSSKAEGTPRLVLDWLDENQIDQAVLFLRKKPDDLYDDFLRKKVTLYSGDLQYSGIFNRIINITRVTYKYCRINRPDMVICWNQGNAHWILTGAKAAGVNHLIVHAGAGPDYQNLFQIFYNLMVFWPVRLLNGKVICASKYLLQDFNKIPGIPGKIFYQVYNCVQVKNFNFDEKGSTGNTDYCGISVGNLEKIKDHELLIKAWNIIIGRGYEWKLIIVGGGGLFEYYRNIIDKLHIGNYIILAGYQNDIPGLLRNAKILIFTSSDKEGFGTVMIEALVSGLKVVAVKIPAVMEVLDNGRYGKIVDSREPADLADAIIETNNLNVSREKKQEQISYASSFTAINMIGEYLKIAGIK